MSCAHLAWLVRKEETETGPSRSVLPEPLRSGGWRAGVPTGGRGPGARRWRLQACKRAGVGDCDVESSRVRAGYGEAVCALLDRLLDAAIRSPRARPRPLRCNMQESCARQHAHRLLPAEIVPLTPIIPRPAPRRRLAAALPAACGSSFGRSAQTEAGQGLAPLRELARRRPHRVARAPAGP